MALTTEQQKEVALQIAKSHKENEPRILKTIWFKDTSKTNEIRIIDVIPGVYSNSAIQQIDLMVFDDTAYGEKIKIILGDVDPKQLQQLHGPHNNWGTWSDGIEV